MKTSFERCAPSRAEQAALTHEQAVLAAESRRLVRAVSPYGVLRRDAIARACGASHWSRGRLDRALEAAVREGRLRRLPLGFYAKPGADMAARAGNDGQA